MTIFNIIMLFRPSTRYFLADFRRIKIWRLIQLAAPAKGSSWEIHTLRHSECPYRVLLKIGVYSSIYYVYSPLRHEHGKSETSKNRQKETD